MKIAVIHGSPRKGVTYEALEIVKFELHRLGEMEFHDIFLPQDLPAFCKGCFQCFLKSEEKCPDAKWTQPLVKALEEADGIIIGTPVYAMQITGGLKAFFDHTAYCYLNHRPRFFRQKALVIATTAGAGTNNCLKYIRQNLGFWGINRIYCYGQPVWAASWKEIPQDKHAKLLKNLKTYANRFYQDLQSQKTFRPSWVQVLMFNAGKALALNSADDNADKQYWKAKGWLEKHCHYYSDVKVALLKRIVGQLTLWGFGRMLKQK